MSSSPSYPFDLTEKLLRHAQIPKLYWQATLAPSHPLSGYSKKLEENIREGRGLLLMGSNGVGKTYSACALLIKSLAAGFRRVMYITVNDLVDSYKPGGPMFDPEDGITMDTALRNRDLLVIDDLGNEYRGSNSGFAEQHLVNLVRYRTANQKAMLVTTNLMLKGIEDKYGPGMKSLLLESCSPVQMTGDDKRAAVDVVRARKSEAGLR